MTCGAPWAHIVDDAGAGKLFGPTLGGLVASLKAAGYQPGQVDEIYITHMHADHVGGLVAEGKIVFPNAVVRADKHDADYWLNQKTLDAAPQEMKGFIEGAMSSLNPYVTAGRFEPFEGDTELVPGVRAVATHGHTPGHAIFVVESKGQKLALWGDLMHVAAVQFANPSVTIKFDTDSKAAAARRKNAFVDAAKNGYWIAAAHLPFPGIGHLRSQGSGYVFVRRIIRCRGKSRRLRSPRAPVAFLPALSRIRDERLPGAYPTSTASSG